MSERVRAARFEPLAALGAALVLAGLFLPWYSVIDVPQAFPRRDQLETYFDHTAWRAFGAVDIALAALALASLRSRVAAIAAAAVIVFELIDAPTFATLGPGPWLALAGALTAAAARILRPWVGAALLFAALLLPWYDATVYIITRGASNTEAVGTLSDDRFELTAWQAFGVLDLALAALALAATRSRAAAAAAVVLVTFRLIDTPSPAQDLRLASGGWLALAGALIALVARRRARDATSP